MLVYEYMSKGSLDKWLFYQNLYVAFDWNTRKKIVIDVAKGLTYLHAAAGKKASENQLRVMVDCRREDMQNHMDEAIDMVRLGMWCSDGDYNRRPSISTVVKILEGWMPLELINNRTDLS
ncbi:Tyrosine-protein kinase [Trema orientale]|uniref:Tyrosine-protein kinase n=1 Tax=Trema orientale TaxID=63057 RepID=A0A2P5DDP7_TREOI|nr:Tyrosine-protein kinase [Trema orientale]